MTTELDGKVAVITGASSGMGAAIARLFSSRGCSVVLAARREPQLKTLAKEIEAAGGKALVAPTDVGDYSQVKALIAAAVERFGRIDVMVNNAGFGLVKSFVDSSIEEIDQQIDVNLKGVCYGCHAVLKHMIERKTGSIINIGSIASVRHFPHFAAYTAAKFGVLGLTRSIYEEVREHGIRMSTICPAAVNTEFLGVAGLEEVPWDLGDMIQGADIAQVVLTCITMPPNVQLENIIMWPTCQATS